VGWCRCCSRPWRRTPTACRSGPERHGGDRHRLGRIAGGHGGGPA
jgi:hypothetical protein